MKNVLKIFIAIALLIIPISRIKAETIANRLKGKILLQVESHGEAYYVHPTSSKAYYMANGEEAYNIMRDLGVGITNKDLEKINTDKAFAKKQSGKIFLQVQAKGEAFYINSDGTPYYLKDGEAAYDTMRSLGLGITNKDLEKVPLFQKYTEQTDKNSKDIEDLKKIITDQQLKIDNLKTVEKTVVPVVQEAVKTTPAPIFDKPITSRCTEDVWSCGDWSSCNSSNIQMRSCAMVNDCAGIVSPAPLTSQPCNYSAPAIPACTSWGYTDWSLCSENGQQTRNIISSSPSVCTGGNPITAQSCTYKSTKLVVDFTGDKTSVRPGETVTLTWAAENAVSCLGEGGSLGDWYGNKDLSGSKTVTINEGSNFKLTCVNGAQSITKNIKITTTYDVGYSSGSESLPRYYCISASNHLSQFTLSNGSQENVVISKLFFRLGTNASEGATVHLEGDRDRNIISEAQHIIGYADTEFNVNIAISSGQSKTINIWGGLYGSAPFNEATFYADIENVTGILEPSNRAVIFRR